MKYEWKVSLSMIQNGAPTRSFSGSKIHVRKNHIFEITSLELYYSFDHRSQSATVTCISLINNKYFLIFSFSVVHKYCTSTEVRRMKRRKVKRNRSKLRFIDSHLADVESISPPQLICWDIFLEVFNLSQCIFR